MPMPRSNIKGMKIGRLTVLSEAGIHPTRKAVLWLCQCECGNRKIVEGRLLRNGTSKSCGCYMREGHNGRTHGQSDSITYSSWRAMLARCKSRHVAYERYTGRGVLICHRWQNSFENFLDDMGHRPDKKHTLDRINNDGNYEPGNCRWATWTQQQRNRRDNVLVTFRGRTMCLKAWADAIGLRYPILQGRLRSGWSVEAMLTLPVKRGVHYRERLKELAKI